jgi:hypothetical protein
MRGHHQEVPPGQRQHAPGIELVGRGAHAQENEFDAFVRVPQQSFRYLASNRCDLNQQRQVKLIAVNPHG